MVYGVLSNCYQVGLISNKDLLAMGISIKKSFEALKTIASLDELILEESAWSFMALNSIFNMLENRESRGDRRVIIAGNTRLPRKKILIPVTQAIVKSSSKPSGLN